MKQSPNSITPFVQMESELLRRRNSGWRIQAREMVPREFFSSRASSIGVRFGRSTHRRNSICGSPLTADYELDWVYDLVGNRTSRQRVLATVSRRNQLRLRRQRSTDRVDNNQEWLQSRKACVMAMTRRSKQARRRSSLATRPGPTRKRKRSRITCKGC